MHVASARPDTPLAAQGDAVAFSGDFGDVVEPLEVVGAHVAAFFGRELKDLQEERRRNAELGVEPGSLRLGLYRALTEIDDPSEIAKVIVRLSAESRRVVGHGRGRVSGRSQLP